MDGSIYTWNHQFVGPEVPDDWWPIPEHQHTAGAHFYFVGAPIYILYIYTQLRQFPTWKKPSTLFYFGGFGGYEWIWYVRISPNFWSRLTWLVETNDLLAKDWCGRATGRCEHAFQQRHPVWSPTGSVPGSGFFCASHVGLVGLSNNRGYWDIPSYGYFEAAHFLNHQVEWDSLSSDKAMFHVWPKSVFLMKGFRSKNWSESGVQLVHWPNDLLSIWPIWPKIWFDEMGVSLFRPCGYFRIVSFVVWKKNEFGKQHFLAGNSCRPGTFLSRAARTGKEALCHGIQWDD